MNKENFNLITEYFIQGQITITTYRMLIETFERVHKLKAERVKLERLIEEEIERMKQGQFNQYFYNAHFITK